LRAQQLQPTSASLFENAEYHFYGALSRAASCEAATADQWQEHVRALAAHHRQLEVWATACPDNFENRAALVGAEIARIEGRALDAEHLYEHAIHSARTHGFVHNEALANEVAARFYAARGFEKIAHAYLQDARNGYIRWRADGKVRQLDELYPHLREEKPAAGPTSIIGAPVEQLDLATVIKVSEALSGEIVEDKLIDTLMRTAIEYAGAERGLLILARDDEYRVEAEVTTSNDTVTVGQRQASVTAAILPESILHYVIRTKESVLLHDAAAADPYSADEYIRRQHTRSILCLPLLKQSKLTGVLYLENNRTAHVFTPARMTVLKLLASQAAMSLENTRLYGDLQEREARIRRLVDSNLIGIFVWDVDGRIIDANDAFLRIVGYDRDDLVSGRLRWRGLTPTEWRDADDRRVADLEATGTTPPYEKEYFRKNGGRVPVLVGAVAFGGRHDQGVAFVVDLTERKRAEEEIRESERRYGEVQMELVHANRVATMGQLSASIAHEITQPITATITFAQTGLRWLTAQPPDLAEARRALALIVQAGSQANDVIGRIRALIKKAPPQKDALDINKAIIEVLALTHGNTIKNGIAVRTQLAEDLPFCQGDRVQLQQVILNLIINAVEAMNEAEDGPRELLISSSKIEANGLLVTVQDSGPGLTPASSERLFEAFYTTKPSGLGIGLSICRSIIEGHGGRLWATSNVPRGAVFQFVVPAPPTITP
jgi:PAS domain S-box-containing protein